MRALSRGFLRDPRLAPATQRRGRLHLRGLGRDLRRIAALVVIAVWEGYQEASGTVEQEANAVAEIFWLAHRLPEPEGPHLQELARSYAQEVVDKEWPLMEQGQPPLMEQGQGTPAGWALLDDLRANLQEVEPRSPARFETSKLSDL
jgi:hypothetical protein